MRELALFGSYARGEASPASDIDFLVELDEKTFDAYMDVKEFLESLFDRPIDLVLKSALKEGLRGSILREAVFAPVLQSWRPRPEGPRVYTHTH